MIGATFLFFLLIARGNLIDATSLFYPAPGVASAIGFAIGHCVQALKPGAWRWPPQGY